MILGSSKPVTCALHRHSAPYRGTFRRGNSSVHVSVKPERRTRELAFTVASLSPKDEGGEQRTESMYFDNVPSKSGRVGKGVNLFDPAATASRFITRRFGLVGGLTFVALLASVEGGEILKALLERDVEGSDEVVKLPSGLSYVDTRIGGGAKPKRGDFVGVHLKNRGCGHPGSYLGYESQRTTGRFHLHEKTIAAPVVCRSRGGRVHHGAWWCAQRVGAC